MKKLTKLGIEELRKTLPVLSQEEQRAHMGGYDEGDCWWRCIAYLKSFGTAYSAQDAMELAMDYYGSGFSESEYSFCGSHEDRKNYIRNHLTGSGYMSGSLMHFKPATTVGYGGDSDEWHTVIITRYEIDYYEIFDPQHGLPGQIMRSDVGPGGRIYQIV